MRHVVNTTRHPDRTGPWKLEHGPFDTKDEAMRYASRLRSNRGWGKVTVAPAPKTAGKAPAGMRFTLGAF